ncbi:hypothetical protein IT570_11970 [Candidatus Sumerlaeota bacterium]|nr:hypothetical protein [Candidatus Sumerlaeota bacterium]
MEPKRLLVVLAERLYDDIRFVTQQNPTQIVDDDGARAYNLLLAKSRKYFPGLEYLPDFPDWQPRTIKYKDALVAAGQLFALLTAAQDSGEDFLRPQRPAAPPAASSSSAPPSAPSPSPSSTSSFRGVPPPPSDNSGRQDATESRRSSSQMPGITTSLPPLAAASPASHASPQAPAPPKPIIPRRPAAPGPPPPPMSSPGSRGGVEDLQDAELYGSRPVPKRREDGTIPFTME